MRRASPVSWAGSVCRDLGMSLKHTENQLLRLHGKTLIFSLKDIKLLNNKIVEYCREGMYY